MKSALLSLAAALLVPAPAGDAPRQPTAEEMKADAKALWKPEARNLVMPPLERIIGCMKSRMDSHDVPAADKGSEEAAALFGRSVLESCADERARAELSRLVAEADGAAGPAVVERRLNFLLSLAFMAAGVRAFQLYEIPPAEPPVPHLTIPRPPEGAD